MEQKKTKKKLITILSKPETRACCFKIVIRVDYSKKHVTGSEVFCVILHIMSQCKCMQCIIRLFWIPAKCGIGIWVKQRWRHGRRQKIFQGGSRTYLKFQGGSKPKNFRLSMVKIRKFAESGGVTWPPLPPPAGAHGWRVKAEASISILGGFELRPADTCLQNIPP